MSSEILLHWFRHPNFENFGDALSPQLVQHLAGESVSIRWVPRVYRGTYMLAVGSLLDRTIPDSARIWGSGIINIHPDGSLSGQYHAVRGRASGKATLGGCQVLGDPGLLTPMLLNPREISSFRKPSRKFRVGFIPHYVDQHDLYRKFRNDYSTDSPYVPYLINIATSSIDVFAKSILAVDFIISSSLHGLVVAHSLGVPAIWVRFSDRVNGDGIKFQEYLESVGIIPYKPKKFNAPIVEFSAVIALIEMTNPSQVRINDFDPEPLISSFPYLSPAMNDSRIAAQSSWLKSIFLSR